MGAEAGAAVQYVERAPKPAELFSRGPHDATATFDIGNPNLRIEAATSFEAGLRRATGPFRFEATGYYTRFNGFIFRQLTGVLCDETFDTCGNPDGELNQAVYSQRNAIFRGGEFQSQLDIAPLWNGIWGVESQFDIVRATFTDGTNVPRIPPVRLGGGVFWRDGNWLRARPAHPRLRADRCRSDADFRRDADCGLQSAQGGAELSLEAQAGPRHGPGRPPKRASASSATTCSTTTSATPSRTPRTRC